MHAPEVQAAPPSAQEESVPPETPVRVIQVIGQSLGIAPEKLFEDRLMEDLAISKPPPNDD